MDWSRTAPFGAIKDRLAWLDQRHQVLARNIANADTPGYVPADVEPFRFRDTLSRQVSPVRLAATAPLHQAGMTRPRAEYAERQERDPVEATPNGNAVDLEEQMAKVNETVTEHKLATQLYRKYLGMVRMAAGARG